jgi:hypothetical protein
VTPRPIRNAQRTLFNVTHPINTAENALLNSVTPRRRRSSYGSATRTVTTSYAPSSYGAAEERAALAQQIAQAEQTLFSSHLIDARPATAPKAPAPETPDSRPIRAAIETERGVGALKDELAPYGQPPSAPDVQRVDRRSMRRDLRKQRGTLPWWKLGERRTWRRELKLETDRTAEAELARRQADHDRLQASLLEKWTYLNGELKAVEAELNARVAAEVATRAEQQAAEQRELNRLWERLTANEPDAISSALRAAFSEAGAVHVVGAFDGCAALAIETPDVEDMVSEQEPAYTSTGRLTVQGRTKTAQNELYLAAIAARLLHVMKLGFAAAPSLAAICCVVLRRDMDGDMVSIYVGTFERDDLQPYLSTTDPDELADLPEVPDDVALELRGRSHEVADLEADDTGLEAVAAWLAAGGDEPDHAVAEAIIGTDEDEPEGQADGAGSETRAEFPRRVTTAWLEREVPSMSPASFQRLLDLLASRGWEDDEIAERVLPLRRE